jgi:hypothetical protein
MVYSLIETEEHGLLLSNKSFDTRGQSAWPSRNKLFSLICHSKFNFHSIEMASLKCKCFHFSSIIIDIIIIIITINVSFTTRFCASGASSLVG